MLLTAEQLQEIRQIIADHHNAFVVNQYGPEAVAPEILEALKAKGLGDVAVKTLEDAYIYGRIAQLLGESAATKMTYPQFRAYVKTNPQPLTAPERHAVAVATQQAAALCQGLGNKIDKTTGQMLIEADGELRRQMQTTIREKTAQNIAQRETLSNLRSEMGHATGDWTRDLNRIAVTETQNAMQQGHAEAIQAENGPDALVAKRTAGKCCDPCDRLYNGPDGAPRIFKLAALQATGTNQGRKQVDWRATVGPLHPNCIPAGTMITTSEGLIAVEHVAPGDYVWTHKQRLRRVTHVWCQLHQGDVVDIDVGWTTLQATPNHLLYDGQQWRPAGAYAVGDAIQRDKSRPRFEDTQTTGATYHDYARVLFGQGPDSPFLALITKQHVFIHDGFVYHRDKLSDGPTVPALQGRLRFTRASALSIAGGDALTLCDPQWVDDACETLVFHRASVHVANELRRRSAPGPFASLHEDWAEPIATDAQVAGDAIQGMAGLKVQAQDQVSFDRLLTAADEAPRARSAGGVEGAADDVAAETQKLGDGGDGHAALMVEARHRIGVQVQSIGASGDQARTAQRAAQRQGADAQSASYVVEGLLVVEMQTRDGVYIDLLPRGGVPGVQVTHGQDVAQTAVVSKVAHRAYADLVYNLTVEQDESYVANSIVSHNCFVGDTLITTRRGLVPIRDVQPGDFVLTHVNRWRQVTARWEQPFLGVVRRIDTGLGVVHTTPNHALWTGSEWLEAGRCMVGQNIAHNVGKRGADLLLPQIVASDAPTGRANNVVLAVISSGFSHDGVPVCAIEFNGELYLREGYVYDVSAADDVSSLGKQPKIQKHAVDVAFEGRAELTGPESSSLHHHGAGILLATTSFLGRGGERLFFRKCQGSHPGVHRCAATSDDDVVRLKAKLQRAARDAKPRSQFFNRKIILQVKTLDEHTVEFAPRALLDADVASGLTGDAGGGDVRLSGHDERMALASADVKSNVAVNFAGTVYNLTVDEDHSYYANGLAASNCRCQIVSVPKGAGFNDQNRMSMTGKKGILTDPLGNETERTHKSLLHKAMQQGDTHIAAMGLPVDVTQWAGPLEQGRWLASGVIPHPSLQVNTIIGPDGQAGEAYVVHGSQSPDAIALGFARPLNAALGYQGRYPGGGIDSMEAISVDALMTYLQTEQDKAVDARPVAMPRERLMLSRSPAIEDAPRLQPKPPKKRQDVGGIKEAWKRPQDFDQSTPVRFDKEANNIYRNTPQMPPRKLDVTTAVLPKKDVRLIIRRNKKRIADQQASNAAAADMLRIGAAHMADFYGLGGDRAADSHKTTDALAADVLSSSDTIKRQPVT